MSGPSHRLRDPDGRRRRSPLWLSRTGTFGDTLLFSDDVHAQDARAAFIAVVALSNRLVDAGRWTDTRARRLLDDIWACGPGVAGREAIAA